MAEALAAPGHRRSSSDEARIRVKAALAVGRYGDALASIRRSRRSVAYAADPVLVLEEAEALFGLLRAEAALAVVSAALRRSGPLPRDLEARLRLCRAQGLWLTGKPDQSRLEMERAAALCTAPLTRARLHELQVAASQGTEGMEDARHHAVTAAALYARAGSLEGVARALGQEARLLRDEGLLGRALEVQTRRLETVSRTTRLDALALVRSDRGGVLTVLGRWEEARVEIERAGELFRQLSDPRELMVVGVSRAVLDLALGRLEAAGLALAQAREMGTSDRTDRWARGEALLISSDQALTAHDPLTAESLASEALRLFASLKDRRGECRSRVRRSHALLGQGRVESAVREARRALTLAKPFGAAVEALGQLALGRALLRADRSEAASAFDRVLALPAGRTDLSHAARLGRALSGPAHRVDAAALKAIEAWGDRRLLTHCVADLQELGVAVGREDEPDSAAVHVSIACKRRAPDAAPDEVVALLDAATELQGNEGAPDRFVAGARALRRVLPWCRAALVGEPGWELRAEATRPLPLSAGDVAREMARGAEGATVIEAAADPRFAEHPARLLHRIHAAILAPLAGGRWVYLDFERDAGPGALGLLVQFARLLDRHLAPAGPPEDSGRRFPGIVGRCPAMVELFQAMEQVAASDTSVHIFGETGTGKERVARALHDHSARARGPFVAVNASSLSDEMFEAEVFGHAKGAFTGAVADRRGYVAEAEGGTLFLDEVTDLSARAQAKLLRFLQEREYRRLGESNQRKANVRLLTASNVPFDDRVADGHFRSDLVYRLNTVTLQLPPLRERGSDIRTLAQHFLREMARRMGRPVPALPETILARLEKHRWPGNVRELANTMERLLTFARGGVLRPELVLPAVDKPRGRLVGTLREAQWAFEREFVSRALAGHEGNKARTAAAIGISRQALLQKIQRLGL